MENNTENQENLASFITLFKNLPELWDEDNMFYKNYRKKRDAYDKLLEVLIKTNKNASRIDVRRKIRDLLKRYDMEVAGMDKLSDLPSWAKQLSFLGTQKRGEKKKIDKDINNPTLSRLQLTNHFDESEIIEINDEIISDSTVKTLDQPESSSFQEIIQLNPEQSIQIKNGNGLILDAVQLENHPPGQLQYYIYELSETPFTNTEIIEGDNTQMEYVMEEVYTDNGKTTKSLKKCQNNTIFTYTPTQQSLPKVYEIKSNDPVLSDPNKNTLKRSYNVENKEEEIIIELSDSEDDQSCSKVEKKKENQINISPSKRRSKRRNNDLYYCPHCTKSSSIFQILVQHLSTHYEDYNDERRFACYFDNCTVAFPKPSQLQQHVEFHSFEDASEISSLFHKNQLNIRNAGDYHKCKRNDCYNQFSTLVELIEHKKQKHLIHGECADCMETFTNANELRQHLFRHPHFELFECTMCGEIFYEKHNLISHVLQTHTTRQEKTEVKSRCGICLETFYQREHLTLHMFYHDDIPVNKCPVCQMTFAKHKLQIKHLIDVHRPMVERLDLVKHKVYDKFKKVPIDTISKEN